MFRMVNVPPFRFRLKHYAGDVTYDVTNFVKKNVDSMSRDLSIVMYRCDLPIMKALFPEGTDRKHIRRVTVIGRHYNDSMDHVMIKKKFSLKCFS